MGFIALPYLPRSHAAMAVFRPGRILGGAAAVSLRALFHRRPSEPQAIEVMFEQAVYSVRIRRHRQARRYTLRIDTASHAVLLTMPLRGSLRVAKEFAQKHGAWIASRLSRLPQATPFAHGVVVPFRGEPHRIVHHPEARGTVWLTRDDVGDGLICVAGEAPHHNRRISDFLRREAQRELDVASRRYAKDLGVNIKRITVRDQSSRWGSCSNTGVLSFSWRLIFAPPYVLEYLAAHEVAHLVELNHSQRFWRLLKRLNPDCERAKVWLDVHGSDLRRYGAPVKAGRGVA
jgi:predicted metal-dependent hydrolase